MRVLLWLLLLVSAEGAFASGYTGELFELKSNFSKKMFHLDVQVKDENGKSKDVAVYSDLESHPVVEETAVVQGDKLELFEIDQKQTREKGRIEVQGDQVLFSYEKDGQKKNSSEKLDKTLVTSANFVSFVKAHWNEVSTDSGMEMRYAVWFRLETVGFKIFKVGEKIVAGKKWIQLKMKPSSFVIAALVDPINLWFDEDSKQLMEMVGRVAPKRHDGDQFKDLDCEVRYQY